MSKIFLPLFAAAAFAVSGAAHASLVVDTGTPGGSFVGALTLDSNDFVAGQFTLAQGVTVQSLATHLLGTTAGETFTLVLYADTAAHTPGALLVSTTSTAVGDGWNGAADLGWTLTSGTYWAGIEVNAGDTLGSGSITGALVDVGAPSPLARTAFNAGSGWQATTQPLSFGLRVEVSAVPEPAAWMLSVFGLAALAIKRRQPAW